MKRYFGFLLILFLFSGCSKQEIHVSEDERDSFRARIEGENFEISKEEICAFPNPCREKGGFSRVRYYNNKLEMHVGDVKNDFSFEIELYVADIDLPVNIVKGYTQIANLDQAKNWAKIHFVNENRVWAETETGLASRVERVYEMSEGTVEVILFEPDSTGFSGKFQGKFTFREDGVYDHNGEYQPYIFPRNMKRELQITNGFFELERDKVRY